jgi:glyoxylase-like metal-dependent hydrolase (beta-lactamase superfamily II)
MTEPAEGRFYFRQLLAGRDFATQDPLAVEMVNFVYLLGDRLTGEAVVVDPAYAVGEILELAQADGMRIVGALATHYHADHVGGDLWGNSIEGIADLLERVDVPIHVNAHEVLWVERSTGVRDALQAHDSGDVVEVGALAIELIHTPGHTPGSQCFMVSGCLVSGDTLFLDGCGRTDLPGSDPLAMYESLTTRLSKVPDETILFPGHFYAAEPSQVMGRTRRENWVLAPRSPEEWMAMFAAPAR